MPTSPAIACEPFSGAPYLGTWTVDDGCPSQGSSRHFWPELAWTQSLFGGGGVRSSFRLFVGSLAAVSLLGAAPVGAWATVAAANSTATPTITVTPASGPVGTEVTITAEGLPAGC